MPFSLSLYRSELACTDFIHGANSAWKPTDEDGLPDRARGPPTSQEHTVWGAASALNYLTSQVFLFSLLSQSGSSEVH